MFSYFFCNTITFFCALFDNILTNDFDLWLRTECCESVRRIDHTSPTKVTPQKRTSYCQLEKYVELTETPIVKKKAKKRAKLRARITLRSSRPNGIFQQNDGTATGCAGINVSCINFTSIYVIDLVVVE